MTNRFGHPLDGIHREIRRRRNRLAVIRGYLGLLQNILILLVILLIVFTQVFTINIAHGTNMFPAVLDGDVLFGYRLDRTFIKNDVVICEVKGKQVVGRVVAKAGDTVNITKGGDLYVNGTVQKGEIAFPTDPGKKQKYPYTVPKDCVYLLGDYRTHTYDSRNFGPVSKKDIRAKIVSVIRRRGI